MQCANAYIHADLVNFTSLFINNIYKKKKQFYNKYLNNNLWIICIILRKKIVGKKITNYDPTKTLKIVNY